MIFPPLPIFLVGIAALTITALMLWLVWAPRFYVEPRSPTGTGAGHSRQNVIPRERIAVQSSPGPQTITATSRPWSPESLGNEPGEAHDL